MNPEQIREIVKITIEELMKQHIIEPENYQGMLRAVDRELYAFFDSKPTSIGYVLRQFSDDPYIDIIYLQYRDKKTMEWIAEHMGKDVSTIKRNKKRIVSGMYKML